jgi:predicted TPR repeat methyltransferase
MTEDASDPSESGDGTITIPEAIKLALEMIGRGRVDFAAEILEHVLRAEPDNPTALSYFGILRFHMGDTDLALSLLLRAAEIDPRNGGVRNNIGNVHIERGEIDLAAEAYEAAIRIDKTLADPFNNLASIWRHRGDNGKAEALLRQALVLNDKNGFAWRNLGVLLMSSDRREEAIDCFWKAQSILPDQSLTTPMLALTYWHAGMKERALQLIRKWAEEEPDNPQAQHLRASFTGENIPPRASDAYVSLMFDKFADSFDAHLDSLQYRAPELVGEAVANVVGGTERRIDILDAGCGTGKCAQYLMPVAASLTGVDLSAGMLARAKKTKAYDALIEGELTAFLADRADSFDMVVSADTLCYFGELDDFARASALALRPGGILIFTVEALGEDSGGNHQIAHHGRYSHKESYVRAVLLAAGLQVRSCDRGQLRLESGRPVMGYIITALKPW